jgi:hypothetical protein
MDTSELAERFFDENEVFYSADARNKIVFNQQDDAPETTANDENKNAQAEAVDDTSSTDSSFAKSNGGEEQTEYSAGNSSTADDEAKNELINEFIAFKNNNQQGTLQEFYAYLANKIKEGNNEQQT